MSLFRPQQIAPRHHFEIAEDGRGHWIARDVEGLVGGIFRSRKDALRFAVDEAEGDAGCVCVLPSPPTPGNS